MNKSIAILFSSLLIGSVSTVTMANAAGGQLTGAPSEQIQQLNTQIQTQLKQIQITQQQQIDALNSQLQGQIKQMQAQLQEQIQKVNSQSQDQMQKMQSALQDQIKQVQQQLIDSKK